MADVRTTLRVTGVHALAAPFRRIEVTTAGPGLHELGLAGCPDEAVLLHVPLPDGTPDPEGRWYTLRRVSADGRNATLDVVVHEGGIGAGWARAARPGDVVTASRCAGWFRRPEGARWQVLVGDAAVLPALARMVEETPPEVATDVVVLLPAGSGPPPLPEGTRTRVVTEAHSGPSRLAEVVRGLVRPAGPGYLYVGGEAEGTRAARKYLRHELGLGPSDYRVLGYWRANAEAFRARYRADTEVFATAWASAEAAGGDEEQVMDRYERALTEAGVLSKL